MIRGRDPVLVAWLVGLILAAVVYAIGPQLFLFRVVDSFNFALWRIGEFVGDLSLMGSDLLRAFAIGLYATFLIMAMSVLRRGGPAKAMLLWVSVLFLWLIGGLAISTESNARWTLALVLAGYGVASMTSRLRRTVIILP